LFCWNIFAFVSEKRHSAEDTVDGAFAWNKKYGENTKNGGERIIMSVVVANNIIILNAKTHHRYLQHETSRVIMCRKLTEKRNSVMEFVLSIQKS
jgi:hypothetical protein